MRDILIPRPAEGQGGIRGWPEGDLDDAKRGGGGEAGGGNDSKIPKPLPEGHKAP